MHTYDRLHDSKQVRWLTLSPTLMEVVQPLDNLEPRANAKEERSGVRSGRVTLSWELSLQPRIVTLAWFKGKVAWCVTKAWHLNASKPKLAKA